jgi:hypothetical protein
MVATFPAFTKTATKNTYLNVKSVTLQKNILPLYEISGGYSYDASQLVEISKENRGKNWQQSAD